MEMKITNAEKSSSHDWKVRLKEKKFTVAVIYLGQW